MPEKQTDQIGQRLKTISTDIKLYVEKRVELLLLGIGEHISRWMAESIQKMTGILFLFGALMCLLVGLAIYLGNLLNQESLGYVIVSIPLMVIGVVLFCLKPKSLLKQLQHYFQSELIKAFAPNGKEEQQSADLSRTSERKKS